MDDIERVIVIGASAGGFKAITDLIANIPAQLPAAIFIVLHLSRNSAPEIVQHHIAKHTELKCRIATDGEPIKRGYIYIAPPDNHLLIKQGMVRITKGPHENRWHPSIDVLFRSAAAAYDSQVIGIVLTGMLDDGTSGMSAIKRSGGVTIVQEPTEAEFPDMPKSVLNNVEVDYRIHINEIGYILEDIFSQHVEKKKIPEDVRIEAQITERMASSIDDLKKIGEQTVFTCPECGGGLWKIKDDPSHRYRCYTGHAFNENVLVESQAEALEESIWVCIRMLEERRKLLKAVASHEQEAGRAESETLQNHRADEIDIHIERLKSLLVTMSKNGEIKQDDYL